MKRALSETRPITADVKGLRGIGPRRIQLVENPSFDRGFSWDVREMNDEWSLYRSPIDESAYQIRGYERIEADSAELQNGFLQLCSIKLPLRPILNGMGGVDGTMYQLALFGDLYSECRFCWWSDAPESWRPLIDVAERMLVAFKRLPVIPDYFSIPEG